MSQSTFDKTLVAKAAEEGMDSESWKSVFQELARRIEADDTQEDPENFLQVLELAQGLYNKETFFWQLPKDFQRIWSWISSRWSGLDTSPSIEDRLLKDYENGLFPADMFFNTIVNKANKIFKEKSDYSRAEKYYSTLGDLESSQYAWKNWIDCHISQKDYEKAAEVGKRALGRLPESELILCNTAFAYYKLKNFKQAINYLEKSIEIGERRKYFSDHLYSYAVKLMANCHRSMKDPLSAFFEYCRLSSIASAEEVAMAKEEGEAMKEFF